MPLQRLDLRNRARRGHDPGHHARAEIGIGDAGHARVADRRVFEQHRLDFGRIDVLAARDDQVVAPVEHPQATVGVEAADVAGVQPAVAQRARSGRGSCR